MQCFNLASEMLDAREVVDLDIAYDDLPEKYYVEEEVSHYNCHCMYTNWFFYAGQHCSTLPETFFVEPYSA